METTIKVNKKLTRVSFGELTIWYSYVTPIAYRIGWGEIVIRANDWAQTTGRHLNSIDRDRRKRLLSKDFERKLRNLTLTVSILP